MIYLGMILLAVSLYFLFLGVDALDFSRGMMRVLWAVLLIVHDRFPDQGVRETVVLLYAVVVVILFAVMRKEVQADHDGA